MYMAKDFILLPKPMTDLFRTCYENSGELKSVLTLTLPGPAAGVGGSLTVTVA